MYEIYERRISDSFAGEGTETLVVRHGIIRVHVRGWDDPHVSEEIPWCGPLTGQPVEARGWGWRRLAGFDVKNAQAWASDAAGTQGG